MIEFIDFWDQKGMAGFIRIFWFYFFLEFPRYVFLDYSILMITSLKRITGRDKYEKAYQDFWSDRPFVSIIIPGKDEGKHYYGLVRSLREQTYQNFELIIVDDGSTDETKSIGRELERRGDIDLFLRNDERGGKASAANLALRYCKGEFIMHLDADCSFNNDAIERALIPFYRDSKIGAVGGNLQVRNEQDGLAATFQAIEYLMYIMIGRTVASSLGILRIVSGAFGAFRKDLLERIQGWDVGPGLDGDITLKIRKLGYKIHFEPSAVALTDVPETFGTLTRQRIRWSRSLVRFRMRKHSSVFKPDKNFDLLNFATVAENIIYDVVLNVLWYIYMIDILINFNQSLAIILITGFLLYSFSKVVEFIVVLLMSPDWRQKLKFVPYLPGMVLYTGYYIRIVRSWAYFKEFFFRSSYEDPWNPWKTSAEVLRMESEYKN